MKNLIHWSESGGSASDSSLATLARQVAQKADSATVYNRTQNVVSGIYTQATFRLVG